MAPAYGVNPEDIKVEDLWTNKTMNETKLTKILKDGFMALKHKQDAFNTSKRLIEEHCQLKNVDAAGWINQITEDTDISQLIKAIDKSVEDKKQAERDEQNRKEYDEAIRKSAQTQINDKTINQDTGEIVDDEAPIDDDTPDQWSMAFRVTGNLEQMQSLYDFIKNNDINNEMIEDLKEAGI